VLKDKSMQKYNFRPRILIPLTLALAILLTGFIVSFYESQKKNLHADAVKRLESLENLFVVQLNSDAQTMTAGLKIVLFDEQLRTALKNKDRKALLEHALPIFKHLQSNHRTTHFYFTGPDRINILRVHKPDKYGDKIDHYTTLEAERSKKISSGIELGPLGTLTLRVVAPWFEGDRLIGYVEFGEEIEHITQSLHKILDVERYILIKKKFLNRENWEAGMRMLDRKAAWDQFPTVVMTDHTDKFFPEKLIKFFNAAHNTSMNPDEEVSLNQRKYRKGFLPLKDAGGREVGAMVIMYDITDMDSDLHTAIFQVSAIFLSIGGILFALFYIFLGQIEHQMNKTSEALRESEARYKNFFDNALAGIFRSRLSDGMFIEMNSKAAEQLGLSVEKVVGKVHSIDLYRNLDQRKELISKLKQDGEVHGFETDLKLSDGRDVTLSISVKAFPDKDYMEGAVIDITKRKQAETDFIKSEARYKQIFENIQDVYYETSIDGTILEISPSIENISQYNRNELVGKSLYDFYTSSEERDELLKLILDKGKVSNFEASLTDKDGSKRFCSISSLLVSDEQDNPIKLVGTMRDVTEKKQAENERKQLEAQLLQAQKMEAIGNLAGGIAHDFNNILTSIIGFTELSLDEVEKGTHLEDNLQEVYTAGKRAKDLVSQILAFARQSGEELKPIQVDMVAAEALKFIRASIPTTIEIRQNIESDSLIMGNATQVHQILMNLFTNAAHAMEEKGGILEFSLKDVVMDRGVSRKNMNLDPGNYVEIKVSDTGVGIAPEIIGAIFDPYFTTKGPGKGTGMGLAMVHGIVKSYGGKVAVDSKPGHGTLFRIYLPVTRKRQGHRPYLSETLPTGTERILFVDDEAPIAKMGGQTLEGLGYTVSIRTSSIEALELFRSKPNDFDLVITDMTMPNMTGDKLAVELMKIRQDVPVILCTGFSKKISDERVSEMGIKAVAYKPIVKADLAKTVRKVLDDQPPKQTTGRILLIDDESEIRKLFIKKLAGRGYEIIEACDGKEGIKLYHEARPDLVITDLVMPEKEGIETITELKREFPNVKIIAISGGGRNVPDGYLQVAKSLGAERTFFKPIDWPELINTVRELLKWKNYEKHSD